jgi:hypothetical protein
LTQQLREKLKRETCHGSITWMGLADRRDDVETGCEPVDSAVKGKIKKGRFSGLRAFGMELTVSHLKK